MTHELDMQRLKSEVQPDPDCVVYQAVLLGFMGSFMGGLLLGLFLAKR